ETRSRAARATSASAVRQRARSMLSRGPNLRAARRRSSRAFGRSPSWAMAIPRRASAAGSSRSATRLSAPTGSPARHAPPPPPRRADRRVHVSRKPVALVTPPAPGLSLFQGGSATTEQGVDDEARSIEGRMAGGTQAAARQGEGVHPTTRRAQRRAAGAPLVAG